jgi:16S rRNA C967 or C1407 C5-methylase (RsmB/RsmF family)
VNNIVKRCQQFSIHSVHTFVCDSTRAVQKIAAPCDPKERHNSVLQGPPFRPESFDRILLDAPCSALGQRPQLANRITVNQLRSYPPLQRKLFHSVSYTELQIISPPFTQDLINYCRLLYISSMGADSQTF